ncbi:MBL fold metallo-hydrolase, partial [Burkholderia cenocepacia]|uniref:MBL fold metallo-hydrolase n=1 Tax=Burkholderia cenocepacia TaxID=95486 RepID=UPI0024B6D2AC
RRDLDRAFLEPPVQGSINAFLVDTGSKRILVDAGAGALYGDCCGKLLDDLRAAGYAPAQIDEVLLTHLHKDHVGGIASNGAMTFPNAVVRVNAVEAAYWLDPANKAHAPAFASTRIRFDPVSTRNALIDPCTGGSRKARSRSRRISSFEMSRNTVSTGNG